MAQKTGRSSMTTRSTSSGGAKIVPLRTVEVKPLQAAKGGIPREDIARRAYDLWVQQGCRHGWDRQHWLEAEKQLKAERGLA
jgi:hypothetical protein